MMTPAGIFKAFAHETPGTHLHLDSYNGLEEGSDEMIIERIADQEETESDDAMKDFVFLDEYIPDAIFEIRYATSFNFIGERIDGYEEAVALCTKEAADALKAVSDDIGKLGYRLKIYDAYRPQRAVDHFARWAKDPHDIRMKEFFYPELDKNILIPQGYIAERSSHSRGSTVDVTLFDMKEGRDADMGGPFDYFGQRSHPDCRDITEAQFSSRMLLRDVMMRHGFVPLETEWWHFTLANEPYPDTYFDFPLRRKK
jgi:D-alanyl-D-alanine dipeptidase